MGRLRNGFDAVVDFFVCHVRMLSVLASTIGYAYVVWLVSCCNGHGTFDLMLGGTQGVLWVPFWFTVVEILLLGTAIAALDSAATGARFGMALARVFLSLLLIPGCSVVVGAYCAANGIYIGGGLFDPSFAYEFVGVFGGIPLSWLLYVGIYIRAYTRGVATSGVLGLLKIAFFCLVIFVGIVLVRGAHNSTLPTEDEVYEERYGKLYSPSSENLSRWLDISSEIEQMRW